MKIRLFIVMLSLLGLFAAASAPATDGPGQIMRVEPKAMTVRVTPNDPSYAVLKPASRVDVIATRRRPNGKIEARIVASNLTVLGVNSHDPKICKSVILLVTREQGKTIHDATKVGSVSLLVRTPD